MRVVLTGMGGALGTLVARALEADPEVEALFGLDVEPPRRHLERAEFHRVDPRDTDRATALIETFAPTVLVHLGVYEPYARTDPPRAMMRTASGTIAALEGAVRGGALESVVLRSGIEVYGRGPATPTRPDEGTAPDPTCPFGESLLHAERVARDGAARAGATAALVRLAPVVGPHFPTPLGRLLRLPAVPVPITGGRPFCVVHQDDAAAALVAAVSRRPDGPVNVVGRGAVTALEAVRIGGGVPLFTWGPGWRIAAATTEVVGAPLPDHVVELLTRGRLADGSRAHEVLGVVPTHSTVQVVGHLHEWADRWFGPGRQATA